MFTRKYRQMNADLQQQLAAERLHMAALDRSMARVEFDPDGNITDANENFLTLLGYRRDEILGKPHRQLCDGAYAQSEDYRRFWERLRRGEHFSGRCKRITREGRPLWLEATYNPVRDGQGRLLKVVKYASDIDAIVHQEHEMQSKLDALSRSMAMIEFDLDGNVLAANDNFLATMGYGRAELASANHRQFCEPGYRDGPQYADLWRRLNRGEYVTGQFRRVHRNGQPVWLEASYNPVYDADGKLYYAAAQRRPTDHRFRPRPVARPAAGGAQHAFRRRPATGAGARRARPGLRRPAVAPAALAQRRSRRRSHCSPLTRVMPARTSAAPATKFRLSGSPSSNTPKVTPNRGVMKEKIARLFAR